MDRPLRAGRGPLQRAACSAGASRGPQPLCSRADRRRHTRISMEPQPVSAVGEWLQLHGERVLLQRHRDEPRKGRLGPVYESHARAPADRTGQVQRDGDRRMGERNWAEGHRDAVAGHGRIPHAARLWLRRRGCAARRRLLRADVAEDLGPRPLRRPGAPWR